MIDAILSGCVANAPDQRPEVDHTIAPTLDRFHHSIEMLSYTIRRTPDHDSLTRAFHEFARELQASVSVSGAQKAVPEFANGSVLQRLVDSHARNAVNMASQDFACQVSDLPEVLILFMEAVSRMAHDRAVAEAQ